jgi:hypothetical protein
MRIMCLSGGTCLPEQREQRRMAWNEDNVSEWRDMSTRAKTGNEDNVSEWRDMSTRAKGAKTGNG